MNDSLIHRRPRRAEIGEFRLGAIALQDVLRRNRFRRALIGDRALDDRPIDAPRSAFRRRFAFGRRRGGDILEAAIDDRLERVKLRRRLVAPITATTTIAITAFAERLAALAASRSAITIPPLAFAALAPSLSIAPLSIASLSVATLIVGPRTIASLAIAVAPTTPAGAALATLLLLRARARSGRHSLAAWRRTFGPRATATPPAPARSIAGR
jgi:hypothetical protein